MCVWTWSTLAFLDLSWSRFRWTELAACGRCGDSETRDALVGSGARGAPRRLPVAALPLPSPEPGRPDGCSARPRGTRHRASSRVRPVPRASLPLATSLSLSRVAARAWRHPTAVGVQMVVEERAPPATRASATRSTCATRIGPASLALPAGAHGISSVYLDRSVTRGQSKESPRLVSLFREESSQKQKTTEERKRHRLVKARLVMDASYGS